ncbi:MAG TPA: transporter [Bacteroidetes bacterium]|nr:transporter [Bacteroidota bacterium]
MLAPTTLFRYGITKGIEIRVLNQFENNKDQTSSEIISGISDLEIGTKIQLLQENDINTEIAFLTHLIIPTGSKGLTNNIYGTINKLSISHQINENIGIGYNMGYNYYDSEKGDLTYSLALGIGINDKAAIYIEPYGDIAEFEKHIASFDAGFTYLLSDNFQLDFSFGTGVNYTMNYISAGFSWNI